MGALSGRVHHGVTFIILIILVLSTPVQFIIGRRFHLAAFKALKRRSPNMDVLVSIATNTSYFYSSILICYCMLAPETSGSHDLALATTHFFTMGPILIAVVLIGKFMEATAKLAAMKALTDLPASMPAEAVLCGQDAGADHTIPVEMVEHNDVLRIFAGAKIPVDGKVCSEGTVYIDESLLTGESKPLPKGPGEALLGGSTCISGGCLMLVTQVGGDTMLGQMVTLVQEAQASKANVQRMADRVARVFVPSVVLLSIATFLVWAVLVFSDVVGVPASHMHSMSGMASGMSGMMDHDAMTSMKLLFAMKFGMAVLMIACPCAMGLATPMAVMVSTGVAAKRGCMVKSAEALEISAQLDAIVLDKTGTITMGAPAIRAAAFIAEPLEALLPAWSKLPKQATYLKRSLMENTPAPQVLGPQNSSAAQDVQACFWWLLGVLESASDHPVATCIRDVVGKIHGLPDVNAPRDFEYFSGKGMRCIVEQLGNVTARVGNLRFYEEVAQRRVETQAESDLLGWVAMLQEQGHTVVIMHIGSQLVGAVALRDSVREDAEWVVSYLRDTLKLDVWLCTGDNTATAAAIAKEVGIVNIVAEALPVTKSECVKQLQSKGGGRANRVCFVGDGVNDSIALAQADVGIAIGVGAQVAVEAADVTLIRSELEECATFLALSKTTFSTIRLNFFWAFCFNFVCLPMAAGVFYPAIHIPPLAAGIGMAGSSCLVVFTSLSLRSFVPPRQANGLASLHEKAPLTGSAHKPSPQLFGNAGQERVLIGNAAQEPYTP